MRRIGALFLVLSWYLLTLPANAQSIAGGNALRIVVGFPPGQAVDIVARLLADPLTAALGQPVIVENRPGQGGSLALGVVAKSPADGSVMTLSALAAYVANPHLYKNTPYNTLKDFDAVALIADLPLVLVTHPSVPAGSLAELVAYAKAHPDGLTNSSSGNGTISHLAMEDLKRRAGIRMIHVPYQGSARAMTDLIAGNIQVALDTVAVTQSFIQSGKMKLLAVGSQNRLSAYPNVPTIAELGYPGFEASAWVGIAVPAGTPKDVVERLNRELVKIVHSPQFEQRLVSLGAQARPSSAEEFSAFMKSEYARWGNIVRESNAKVD